MDEWMHGRVDGWKSSIFCLLQVFISVAGPIGKHLFFPFHPHALELSFPLPPSASGGFSFTGAWGGGGSLFALQSSRRTSPLQLEENECVA